MLVWNRTKKRSSWGKVDQRARPTDDRIEAMRDDLQIVADDVWARVQSRVQTGEDRSRSGGRPPKTDTQNLLSGIASCGVCGGGLAVETSGRKDGRVAHSVCHRRRHYAACANVLRVRVEDLNEAVLHAIEEHALTPKAVEHVVQLTERDDVAERREELTRDRADVERRITTLLRALKNEGTARTIVERVRDLEQQRDALDADLTALQPVPRLPVRVVASRMGEWRRLLCSSTTQARAGAATRLGRAHRLHPTT